MRNERGFFVTFEGIDGCGKSTQSGLLAEYMRARYPENEVLRTFEPGGWDGGALLRGLLLGNSSVEARTELLLFLADRSGHLDTTIQPALKRGACVVCERYTDSTLAYQSWGRGIPLDDMKGLLEWCNFPAPDLTVLLDIDPRLAEERLAKRGKADRIEACRDGFMERAVEGYRELARREPERIAVVDASRGVEKVAEEVARRFEGRLEEFLR